VQWLRRNKGKSEKHPLDGSVVQRLQRFATYGSLKQQVLRIITDELAISHEKGQDALKKVRIFWGRPWHPGVLQVLGQRLQGWAALASWRGVVFNLFACFCMFVHGENVHSHFNMNQAPDVAWCSDVGMPLGVNEMMGCVRMGWGNGTLCGWDGGWTFVWIMDLHHRSPLR
jgi:hypothetical protein